MDVYGTSSALCSLNPTDVQLHGHLNGLTKRGSRTGFHAGNPGEAAQQQLARA
jgi:hypothetical protein